MPGRSFIARSEAFASQPGPYSRIRRPQYVGFVLIMFGFLLQWPTLVTVAMFPVLATMYVLLALREERESEFRSTFDDHLSCVRSILVDSDSIVQRS